MRSRGQRSFPSNAPAENRTRIGASIEVGTGRNGRNLRVRPHRFGQSSAPERGATMTYVALALIASTSRPSGSCRLRRRRRARARRRARRSPSNPLVTASARRVVEADPRLQRRASVVNPSLWSQPRKTRRPIDYGPARSTRAPRAVGDERAKELDDAAARPGPSSGFQTHAGRGEQLARAPSSMAVLESPRARCGRQTDPNGRPHEDICRCRWHPQANRPAGPVPHPLSLTRCRT